MKTILPWTIVLILTLVIGYTLVQNRIHWFDQQETHVNSQTIIEQIEYMGKLELSKYHLSEVIEHTEKQPFYMPDDKFLLVTQGEVVGCIDLSKIEATDIENIGTDSLLVRIPPPEICYVKVNLQKTRIYKMGWGWMDDMEVIQKAYQEAEMALHQTAIDGDILENTNQQAVWMLTPLFENISQKKVIIQTEMPTLKIESIHYQEPNS